MLFTIYIPIRYLRTKHVFYLSLYQSLFFLLAVVFYIILTASISIKQTSIKNKARFKKKQAKNVIFSTDILVSCYGIPKHITRIINTICVYLLLKYKSKIRPVHLIFIPHIFTIKVFQNLRIYLGTVEIFDIFHFFF